VENRHLPTLIFLLKEADAEHKFLTGLVLLSGFTVINLSVE